MSEVMTGRDHVQGAGGCIAGVGGDEPPELAFGWVKGGVLHSQRTEDSLLQEDIEGLAAHDFADPGRRVDAALAVAPP